jgi:small-conductance mechanosensitive channel
MDFGLTALVDKYLPDLTFSFLGSERVIDFSPYILLLILFLGLYVFFRLLRLVVINRLETLSKKTSNNFDDAVIGAIARVPSWIYVLVALFISLQTFDLPTLVDQILTGVTLFVVVWQGIEVAVGLIDYGVKRFVEKDEDGDGLVDPNSVTASDMIKLMARLILWALGSLFVLSNLGIEVTSLIAGLGIGGIAVAFALQGILSDLFASFSIYFDKPFRIGDFVVIGTDSGTVEKIGIKSTRIRTLQGEELVVSNAELTTTRVQNFKKMQERRISFQFGITYETHHDEVKEVLTIVKRIFEAVEGARLDRVHFISFGDFALIYEVVYFVESSDYNEYLDIQQQVNFEMMDTFRERGINFAYPTQTVLVKQVG